MTLTNQISPDTAVSQTCRWNRANMKYYRKRHLNFNINTWQRIKHDLWLFYIFWRPQGQGQVRVFNVHIQSLSLAQVPTFAGSSVRDRLRPLVNGKKETGTKETGKKETILARENKKYHTLLTILFSYIENTTRIPVGDDLSYNEWFLKRT